MRDRQLYLHTPINYFQYYGTKYPFDFMCACSKLTKMFCSWKTCNRWFLISNIYLYIRNLKYCTFNTIFTQYPANTNTNGYWVSKKTVLNVSWKDFWCANINNHLICLEKTINAYLKAKISLHTTRISSFKYVFIVFSEKNRC